MSDRRQPKNPLVLDEDYDKLFDEDFIGLEDLEESDAEFEQLSYGGRRRKPQINSDF